MQLRTINQMIVVLLSLFLSATASCSQTSSAQLKWKSISDNDMLIDVTLPSGIEVKGIRYRKERLTKNWHLEITNTTGSIQSISEMTIHSSNGEVNSLSQQDFKDLFSELVSFIKKNNNGQLDRVHIRLGFVTELWEDTASFLRQDAVQSNYKLKPKDRHLARKISLHLKDSSILKALCEEVMQMQKACKNNFVGMNPITFEPDYIGKEWSQVEMLPNTGIPTDKLWFGLSLSNMAKQ